LSRAWARSKSVSRGYGFPKDPDAASRRKARAALQADDAAVSDAGNQRAMRVPVWHTVCGIAAVSEFASQRDL